MKVDTAGRVFCTGPSGVWVFAPDGTCIGIIETPEVTANVAFGGPDLRTLFMTSSTSIYTLRVKTPGCRIRGTRRASNRRGAFIGASAPAPVRDARCRRRLRR